VNGRIFNTVVRYKNGVMMNRKLKITFILPGAGIRPSGGFKVVYEYANRLSRLGHQVTVIHPAFVWRHKGLREIVRSLIKYYYRKTIGGYRPDIWFDVDSSVRLLWVPFPSDRYIPDGDAIIATAWGTAEWVCGCSASKGRGYYLIQSLETWAGPEEKVYATWRAPLRQIVIANWLMDIAKGLGVEAVLIPNGLNSDEFEMDISPEDRDPKRIMMLYHKDDLKGSAEGIEALSMVRLEEPEIKAVLFGVPPRPASLPEWIEYHQQPKRALLRALYNHAAIFVAPSWIEGWPLPPAEAMLCGAALVATDIGGHREYAFHDDTALLSPSKDPLGLADNILRLVRDPSMRVSLATRGHKYIQQFTWERATDRLESVLCECSENIMTVTAV
jgi:glycosyltransferase involved in cell wall biosynthesis